MESIDISAFCNTGLNAAELPSNLKHLENERKNLIECAIKGFIVGDVIGIPYEGKKRNSFICNGIRRSWIKDSHFILPIGTWSDDTSLMLCVLDCLAENPKSIARLWRKRAFYFILGGYTNHFFKIPYDIGKATMIGIIKLRLGIKNKNACKEKANGNGGLMRIPPLSLMGLKNEELVNYVKVFNSCSHNTDLSNQCCIFYILYVKQVAIYEKIDAYKKAICLFRCLFLNPETQMNRILSGKIQDIQESEIVSSGYVIHTLEAVLWAFLNTKDYNNALLKAINLGGDTDTIGALTGWIAGVYYKTYNLEWYKKVKRKKFVEKKIEKIKNNIDKQHLNNYG